MQMILPDTDGAGSWDSGWAASNRHHRRRGCSPRCSCARCSNVQAPVADLAPHVAHCYDRLCECLGIDYEKQQDRYVSDNESMLDTNGVMFIAGSVILIDNIYIAFILL